MKKLLGIFMAAVTVIAACVGFVGCKEKKPAGAIYSLDWAYEYGFLTKEDLEQIAYYNNNGKEAEETLGPKIEQKIKETLAYEMRHGSSQVTDATADGFWISKYYGEYNDCYVFKEANHYVSVPTGVPDGVFYEVGGVQFAVTETAIRVWKAN